MHEKEHILRHFISPKDNIIDSIERTNLGESMVNFINSLYQIIDNYDDEQYVGRLMFKKEMKELKQYKNKIEIETLQKISLMEQEMLKSLSKINYNKILSPYEEIGIDISNINELSFNEKNDYYSMLKTFLPKHHKRLKPIQLNLQLSQIEQHNLYKRDSILIKSFNSYMQYYELMGNQGNRKHINTHTFLKNITILNENIYRFRRWKKTPLNFKTFMSIIEGRERYWHKTIPIEKQVYSFIKKLYNMKKLEMRLDSLIKYLTVKADYEDSYIDYIKSSFDTGGL